MGQNINLNEKFLEYLHEVEGYCLRSERFYESLNQFSSKEALARSMLLWLEAAYQRGAQDMARDTLYTLGDYATSLAGLDEVVYTREQAYDAVTDSLDAYYTIVIEDFDK